MGYERRGADDPPLPQRIEVMDPGGCWQLVCACALPSLARAAWDAALPAYAGNTVRLREGERVICQREAQHPPLKRVRLSTIGDVIDIGYRVDAYCGDRNCEHNARLDLEALARRLGRDHPCNAAALRRRLRCGKCGRKNISFRMAYDFKHHT